MGKSDHAGRWCKVSFVLARRGDDDSDWLDELVSVLPSKSWRKGEPWGGVFPPRGTSGWCIATGRKPHGDAQDAFREIMDGLRESSGLIRRSMDDEGSGWRGSIFVTLGGDDDRATLTLDPADLRRVAELGFSVGVRIALDD